VRPPGDSAPSENVVEKDLDPGVRACVTAPRKCGVLPHKIWRTIEQSHLRSPAHWSPARMLGFRGIHQLVAGRLEGEQELAHARSQALTSSYNHCIRASNSPIVGRYAFEVEEPSRIAGRGPQARTALRRALAVNGDASARTHSRRVHSVHGPSPQQIAILGSLPKLRALSCC
jgi:hypothetical protein